MQRAISFPSAFSKAPIKNQNFKMACHQDQKLSPKSAYVTSEIFFDWLKNHFYPHKPPGKEPLILDGHSSYLNDAETLDFAMMHDNELLYLPSHCTHYLQPLDRAFFKLLKAFIYKAANNWMMDKREAQNF